MLPFPLYSVCILGASPSPLISIMVRRMVPLSFPRWMGDILRGISRIGGSGWRSRGISVKVLSLNLYDHKAEAFATGF